MEPEGVYFLFIKAADRHTGMPVVSAIEVACQTYLYVGKKSWTNHENNIHK